MFYTLVYHKKIQLILAILILLLPLLTFSDDNLSLFDKAYSLHRQSKNKESLKLILQYLKTNPKNYKAQELTARLYEMKGNHEQALFYWLKLMKQDHPLNSFYIPKIASSLISRNERRQTIKAFLRLLNKTRFAIIKFQLYNQLSELYREEGKLKKSRYFIKQLNTITKWKIIGPFDNDRHSGFNRVYPPEIETSLKKKVKGKRVKVSYRDLPFPGYNGVLNLKSYFYPNEGVIAYGVTFVYSPKDQDALIYVSASDGVKLWLNDALLLSHRLKKEFQPDQFRVQAHLSRGWNKILFKSAKANNRRNQNTHNWKIAVRLTSPSGKTILRLRYSTNKKSYKKQSSDKNDSKAIEQFNWAFPTMLSEKIKNESQSNKLLYKALWFKEKKIIKNEVKTLELLIKLEKKSTYIRTLLGEAYLSYEEWGKGISALKQAIKLDKNNFMPHYNLAQYYYKKKLYDKSLEKFKSLKAMGFDNIAIDIYMIRLMNKKSWYYDALKKAKKLVSEHPQSYIATVYLALEYSHLKKWDQAFPTFQRAVKYNYSGSYSRERIFSLASQEDRFYMALSTARELIKLYPSSVQYRMDLGNLFLKYKQYKDALNVYFDIIRFSPHHPDTHKRIGDCYKQLNKQKLSLKYYSLALSYNPKNHKLREYVKFLAPKNNRFFTENDLNKENVRKIIAKAPKIGKYPKSIGVILLKKKIIEVFDSGAYNYLVHNIIQISNQAGVRAFNQIKIPKKIEKLLKAVTIIKDGKELEATVFAKGKISFPSLEVGSIIEYKYMVERTTGEWLEDHFHTQFFFQSSYPVLKSELILSIPENKHHKIYLSHSDIESNKIKKNGRVIYHWTSMDNPQIFKEQYRPPFRDITKRLMLTTVPSWNYLARWQRSLISDQFEADNAIKEKVKSLTKNKKTISGKIKAIYYYVSNDIYYLNNDVGIFGKLPNRCSTVFTNKFGDCKDKGTLLISMLKVINVKAYYAAVRTNHRGRLIKAIPASQTNHIITYIPKQKGIEKAFFVDSTSELYPFRYIRPDSQGVWALVFKGKEFEIIKTPVYSSDRTVFSEEYEITFENNKNLNIHLKQMATGAFAKTIRKKYKIEKKRKELLETSLNKRFQGVENLETQFSPLRNLDKEVQIESRFVVKDCLKNLDGKIQLQAFHLFKLTSAFAQKTEREHDIEFLYGFKRRVKQRINIPKGYTLSHKPKNFSVHFKELFHFSIRYDIKENEIIRTKELSIEKGIIKKSNYPEFRKLCIKGDRADQSTLTFNIKK